MSIGLYHSNLTSDEVRNIVKKAEFFNCSYSEYIGVYNNILIHIYPQSYKVKKLDKLTLHNICIKLDIDYSRNLSTICNIPDLDTRIHSTNHLIYNMCSPHELFSKVDKDNNKIRKPPISAHDLRHKLYMVETDKLSHKIKSIQRDYNLNQLL